MSKTTEEGSPSVSDIIDEGAPPEYIPIVVISAILCIFVIVLFVRAVNQHRRYVTKHTMQGLCTLGIILTFPVLLLMYFTGIIVPKAMPKVTFISETYEAISVVFFLRLLMVYMGGKKRTLAALEGHQVALSNPPLCCLVCLPHVKFTRMYMAVHEGFIVQLFVYKLVLGYIDLLIGIDESHAHPAALVEETYSHYFHGFALLSLLLAIYGLGGIYHAAEERLKNYRIFRKFILYKAFVTVVKIEEILVSVVTAEVVDGKLDSLKDGAIPGKLRVHMWCYFLVIVEAATIFPFLLRAYSTADYPAIVADGKVEEVDKKIQQDPDHVSFPTPTNGIVMQNKDAEQQ